MVVGIKYMLLLCSVLVLFTGCIEYKEVEVLGLEDVSIGNIDTKGAQIEISVRVSNPNNYKIKITDSDLDLFLSGKKVGKATIGERIIIPKNSNEVHTFNIDATFKEMGGALGALITFGTKSSLDLKVSGFIKAKAFGVGKKFPVDFEDNVSMPKGGFGG